MVVGSNPVAATYTSDVVSVLSRRFLDIHTTTECRFTLKCVRDMIITYSQPKTSSCSTHRKHGIFIHSGNTLNYGDRSLRALGPHTWNSYPKILNSPLLQLYLKILPNLVQA